MISQISLLNYRTIVEPNLNNSQKEVLKAMKALNRACTNEEVALAIGKWPSATSGRFTELKEKGLIIKVDEVKVGRSTHGVFVLAPDEAE